MEVQLRGFSISLVQNSEYLLLINYNKWVNYITKKVIEVTADS